MTITEKKPLLIRIPGEITPNELPITASAVGYDFVEGNYLIYATGSDSWVTAPPNTAGIQQYWQSDVTGSIFTTGSIYVSGSVTGSNLILNAPASRIIAPNGALVISSSAGTFITGSLVVSGTRSNIGTEQASILFNGDLFVSGGIGLNDYIQLKPVGALNIPTLATASYIFTSGSEDGLQDLYFAQYGGPYTNITRLRWLEGALSTGLLHGGLLSTQNGSTTFSITSGSGIIVKYNATFGTDPYPTINLVRWPAYVSQSLTNSGSAQITYIGINSSGTLLQQVTPFVDADYQEYLSIGRVLHQSGSVTNGTITSPIVGYGSPTWTSIFTRAIGPLKTTGHVLAASGSTRGLTKTAGNSYVEGRNYSTNPESPNSILSTTDTAVTISKIYREHVSGSTPIIDSGIGNAGYTEIDPTRYNLNGTLTTILPNKTSIQRVYWFPNSVNRAFFVYYGPKVYDTLDQAQAAIAEEEFIEGANTAGAAILVAYILVDQSCTSLLNPTKARIIQAGPFRGSAAGGGSVAGTTNPGGSDTYVQFNDAGIFGGDAGLTFDKVTGKLTTTSLVVSSIATVSGNVILGDAASDVVYISGNVTASNSLTVTGSIYSQMIRVNGNITDPTPITVPGYGGTYNLNGSAFFDDTVTNGNTYGTVIRSQAGDLAYATLTFIQDNTYAGAVAGLKNTPSPDTLGYLGGLNLSAATGKRINFRFNSNPAISVGNFNANGLEVTGSLNVSNGAYINGGNAYINAGGMKVVGSLSDGTSISSFTTKGSIIVDDTITDGSSQGIIIRNQSALDTAYANLTFVQNNTLNGQITGINNTPGGITYGLLGGLNIAALKDKTINFRATDLGTPANSYSFGKFSSTGLDVTGVVTASLGFSGSLTRLTDGTPYLLAGPNITLSTGSKGQIAISGSASSATGKQHLSGKEIINSTSPIMTSQFAWIPSDYTGLSFVGVRAIMATDGTENLTGSLQIYNLTSGSYVDLTDTPTVSSYFTVTSSAPTFITSSNLLSGITNFDNNADSIYEVRVSGSTTNNIVVGSVELIFR